MRQRCVGGLVAVVVGGVLFASGWAAGQGRRASEKSVMHVVPFTLAEDVGPGDVQALREATEVLAASIPGMRRAWVGKLRQPVVVGDATRTHGLIFEFDDVPSREAYSTHPNRVAWAEIWGRVRRSGTVFDVVGE